MASRLAEQHGLTYSKGTVTNDLLTEAMAEKLKVPLEVLVGMFEHKKMQWWRVRTFCLKWCYPGMMKKDAAQTSLREEVQQLVKEEPGKHSKDKAAEEALWANQMVLRLMHLDAA